MRQIYESPSFPAFCCRDCETYYRNHPFTNDDKATLPDIGRENVASTEAKLKNGEKVGEEEDSQDEVDRDEGSVASWIVQVKDWQDDVETEEEDVVEVVEEEEEEEEGEGRVVEAWEEGKEEGKEEEEGSSQDEVEKDEGGEVKAWGTGEAGDIRPGTPPLEAFTSE
jgi:hypothetical protein